MLKCVANDIFFAKGVIDTHQHLGRYFKALHFLIEQTMNRQLTELDLTSAQAQIIGFLTHAKEPPCARDMENHFGLSHPTVSGLLSRMEAKGFIEVRPDPMDRRIKRIYLLERGNACSQQICRYIRENDALMVRGFSPEEQELFVGFLQRCIHICLVRNSTVPKTG